MAFWKIIGLIGGACLAPFTGGTSLVTAIAVCGGIGLVAGHFLDEDQEKKKKENQQLALNSEASKEIKQEVNNLQDQRSRKVQQTEDLVNELNKYKTKEKDPNATPEEKAKAKQMIPILQSQLDDLINDIKVYDKKIEDLLKNIPGVKGLGIQGIDTKKLLIIGGACLAVYLLVIKDKDR